jgi:hypothetical protein
VEAADGRRADSVPRGVVQQYVEDLPDAAARRRNSPLWLYHQHGLRGRKLLLICGRQDKESWPPNQQMLGASRGDPGVSFLDFPTGGHNYRNYRRYLPDALQWLDHVHVTQ